MRCNKCGAEVKFGAKFCTNCGNKTINVVTNTFDNTSGKCPKCGADISGKKFCTACGYKILTSQSTVNAQVVDMKIDDSIDIETLYKRAFMYLEDDKRNEALTYFEHFLDRNPEDSRAYFGKLMIECGYAFEDDFRKLDKDISNSKNFKRAYKYGDDKLKEKLDGYILTYVKNTIGKVNTPEEIRSIYTEIVNSHPNIKVEAEKLLTEREAQIIENYYQQAVEFGENAKGKDELLQASKKFSSFNGYKDSEKLAAEYKKKSKDAENDAVYNTARRLIDKPDCTISALQNAITAFESIKDWKDSQDYIEKCHKRIAEIKEEEDARRAEAARQEKEAAEARARAKKLQIRILLGILAFAVLVIAGALVYANFIKPSVDYDAAIQLMNDGDYLEASKEFEKLGDYKDCDVLAENCIDYDGALKSMESGNYNNAISKFKTCGDFHNAKDKITECENHIKQAKYDSALVMMNHGKYESAVSEFEALGDFSDSKAKIGECNEIAAEKYIEADKYFDDEKYDLALEIYQNIAFYGDSADKIEKCNNKIASLEAEEEKKKKEENAKKEAEEKELASKRAITYLGGSLGEIFDSLGEPYTISQESWGVDGGFFYLAYNYADMMFGVYHCGVFPGANNSGIWPDINAYLAWTSEKSPIGIVMLNGNGEFDENIKCGITYNELCNIGYLDIQNPRSINYDTAYGAFGEASINGKTYNFQFEFNSEYDLTVKNIRIIVEGDFGFVENYSVAYVKLDEGFLNVRDEPNGNVVDKLYDGDNVHCIYDDGKWAFIRYDSVYGYVASEFLE